MSNPVAFLQYPIHGERIRHFHFNGGLSLLLPILQPIYPSGVILWRKLEQYSGSQLFVWERASYLFIDDPWLLLQKILFGR